ncbi:fimbrial protein [Parashewanella spongiae]|uniref:Fimbrial protein n=1 Tax=Parashewanella spongiae TaxID=342950 RepID=A0A3A6TVI8_9GAMM|nr:PilN domain-containing protein [Parashewanella spongiae]MCL1078588.1 PilN domain-containing protein [Parashewanella spongiae]RJY13112.1 fimbrial protein [Parashewanella spongiae]
MANVNLLPWREEAREKKKRDYLGILALVFIFSSLMVYSVMGFIGMMKDEQRDRNTYLKSEIQLLETQIQEIRAITKRRENIERRTDIILDLQQARNLPTRVLDELVRIVPPGIYLSNIEKKGNLLWIEGLSESNNHVTNMMRKVETSKWLDSYSMKEIVLKETENRQLHKFSTSIRIVDKDLSMSLPAKEVAK